MINNKVVNAKTGQVYTTETQIQLALERGEDLQLIEDRPNWNSPNRHQRRAGAALQQKEVKKLAKLAEKLARKQIKEAV